jgi:hypothetical protein
MATKRVGGTHGDSRTRHREATVRLSDVTVTTIAGPVGHEWICLFRGVREAPRISPRRRKTGRTARKEGT